MTALTPERLAELRRVAEAATPGPWRSVDWSVRSSERGGRHAVAEVDPQWGLNRDGANLYYIAEFDPPTVLELLDAAARNAELEAEVEWHSARSTEYATELAGAAKRHDEMAARAERAEAEAARLKDQLQATERVLLERCALAEARWLEAARLRAQLAGTRAAIDFALDEEDDHYNRCAFLDAIRRGSDVSEWEEWPAYRDAALAGEAPDSNTEAAP